MKEMMAVVKHKDGKGGWAYEKVARKDPAENEVEIEIKSIGICGSELHLYHDNHFYTPPVVVGHEFCGEISRVGRNVKDWKTGDRVVAALDKGACGNCEFCRRGMPNFCTEGKAVGYDENGGWTEYYCTPQNTLFRLPENVSFEEGSMTEPCNVACQALSVKKTVQIGDLVLVQGCGTIGMISAMVAKAIGAGTVMITGTNVDEAVRLPLARSIEAIDHVVNVEQENLYEKIMEFTQGKGADVIVEASGAVSVIQDIVKLIKKTGNIVVLGETSAKEIPIPWNDAVLKACTIYFSFGEVYDAWNTAIKLMGTNKLELGKLITHRVPLAQFRKGFELLEQKDALKVILEPERKEDENE